MAKVVTDDKHYKAIADAIRDNLPDGSPLKNNEFTPSEMPSAVGVVRAMGEDTGYWGGYSDGEAVTDAILSNVNIGHYRNDRITSLAAHAFNYRTSLLSLNLPNVVSVSTNSVANCSNLTELHLPSLARGGTNAAFSGCSKLTFADLGVTDTVSANTFLNCSALTTVVLRGASISSLANLNAFSGTPFAQGGTGGTLVVKSALIEQYKTATNWSVLYGYGTVEFVVLEGSEYE